MKEDASTSTMAVLAKAAAHLQAGRHSEAKQLYRQVLAGEPSQVEALLGLAQLAHERGEPEAALKLIEQAIATAPQSPALHNSRGVLLDMMQRCEDALVSFQKSLRLKPDDFNVCVNLATVLCKLGRYKESEEYFRHSRMLRSGDWQGCARYGEMLLNRNQYARAASWFREALALQADQPQIWDKLGLTLRNLGRFSEAEDAYREALRLKPDFAAAHCALLSMLGYHVLATPAQILAEHQAWDRVHGGAQRLQTFSHSHLTGRKRRLRIGYVSPDLYRHAVSYFIEPILEYHDRGQVEVYCYAEVHNPDEVTARLQGKSDVWRSIVGLDDETVAHMIHEDSIDVLVDLAGHSHADRSRIKVFTYKPAPVQVTYLGYFTTTGLQAMDYWLTDEVTCPEETKELAVESIYRLPRCCVSYSPPQDAPPVTDRPAAGEAVTFGCFNNLAKIGPAAVEYWSRILHSLPSSRLVLKAGQLADPAIKKWTMERFSHHGVEARRLTLLPYTASLREHFALHGEIDIALDTAPRTGVTTTADALWMGVPVITLAGERFIERLGASLMTSIGMEDLIAGSSEEYVAKAVALARDEGRRRHLRQILRQRMQDSPLCDGRDLARVLERTFLEMWNEWAATEKSHGHRN